MGKIRTLTFKLLVAKQQTENSLWQLGKEKRT